MINFIFCFYDLGYSPQFLKSWVNLCNFLNKKKVKYLITQGDSCNAFYAKQMCLGGSVLAGSKQKPFQGRTKYSTLVFLSNNIIFTVEDFVKLVNRFNKLNLPTLSANVEGRNKLIGEYHNNIALAERVEFDMTLIRSGIIEKLSYPWFKPHIPEDNIDREFVDVEICRRIREEAMTDLYISNEVNLKKRKAGYE